jgi:hypothetical protein
MIESTTIVAQELCEMKIEEEKIPTLEAITKSAGSALDHLIHRQNTRSKEEMRGVAEACLSLTLMTGEAEMIVSLMEGDVAR